MGQLLAKISQQRHFFKRKRYNGKLLILLDWQWLKYSFFSYKIFTNLATSYLEILGAYYYWLTEKEKNYETTVLDVVRFSQELNIPFKLAAIS